MWWTVPQVRGIYIGSEGKQEKREAKEPSPEGWAAGRRGLYRGGPGDTMLTAAAAAALPLAENNTKEASGKQSKASVVSHPQTEHDHPSWRTQHGEGGSLPERQCTQL